MYKILAQHNKAKSKKTLKKRDEQQAGAQAKLTRHTLLYFSSLFWDERKGNAVEQSRDLARVPLLGFLSFLRSVSFFGE